MGLLERYGYPALALLVLLEGLGIPTPAVTAVVTAAAFAAHGRLWMPAVAVITFVTAVAGDNLGYLVGRRAGRAAILRWGHRVGVTEHRLAKAERFIATRGRNIIVVARFVDGVRQTNGLIAGATMLPWAQYAIRDAIGAVIWTALWVTFGAVVGVNLRLVERFEIPLAAAVIAVVLFFLIRHLLKRRARNR